MAEHIAVLAIDIGKTYLELVFSYGKLFAQLVGQGGEVVQLFLSSRPASHKLLHTSEFALLLGKLRFLHLILATYERHLVCGIQRFFF